MTLGHPPGGRLLLLSARPAVTFPAEERHRPSVGTKLYCLLIEAHACEQLAQGWGLEADRTRFEPATFWVASERSTVTPHRQHGLLCNVRYSTLIMSTVSKRVLYRPIGLCTGGGSSTFTLGRGSLGIWGFRRGACNRKKMLSVHSAVFDIKPSHNH